MAGADIAVEVRREVEGEEPVRRGAVGRAPGSVFLGVDGWSRELMIQLYGGSRKMVLDNYQTRTGNVL